MTDGTSANPEPRGSRAKTAVTTARRSVSKAADATTGTARDFARKTADAIDANPIAVLAGGTALGVLAGAFLPRSTQETNLLRPVGKRLTDTARGAVDAARDSATSQFDMLGLTRNAARDQVGKLIGDVVKALAVAGTAALTSAKAASSAAPSGATKPTTEKSASKKAKPTA